MRRRRRHKGTDKVDLNLAAMLDMAFQLLAFFILTFRPAPVEGYLQLKLPPPVPMTDVQAGTNDHSTALAGVPSTETLHLVVTSDAAGTVDRVSVGRTGKPLVNGPLDRETVLVLQEKMKFILEAETEVSHVQLAVDGRLHYEELMKIIDCCTRKVLADGQPLTKVSFVDLPLVESSIPAG
jgi:biopolymer transport protein ExbD